MAKRKKENSGNMRAVDEDSGSDDAPMAAVKATHHKEQSNGNLTSRSRMVTFVDSDFSEHTDVHLHNSTQIEYGDISLLPVLEYESMHPREDIPSIDPDYQAYLEETAILRQPRSKKPSDAPMKEWLEDRELFLSEFVRLEGRGTYSNLPSCCECHKPSSVPSYRCVDCHGADLVCRECVIAIHQRNGLHWIEKWDFDRCYFKKVSLKSLGYRFQLGHALGERCVAPEKAFADSFVVVHTNGIHEIGMDFCGCEISQPHCVQLLRFGWFPATVKFPRSASTLHVLKLFQMLSFESKTSAFEFYHTLVRLSDNTGIIQQRTKYTAFLLSIRQYRHLKMLKRAGRGHSRTGAAGTQEKECAVVCPACPRPGINLPDGWDSCAPEERFLYCLFLAIDANFRLKRKMVSSNASDPSLSAGWAYFVNDEKYKDFLNNFGKIILQETSNCSNHDAVNKERGKAGLAASGVGTVDCSRHDMKRPTSVGDLQKGERIENHELSELVVSYDIACQWSVHIWDRMRQYPQKMHVDKDDHTTFRFMIPKFHLPAHILACQSDFSFNFNRNVGRTDGEGVERGWSNINPISASTREMGPGSRRDTLDDHFGDWNWKKTTLLGLLLLRRMKAAVPEMVEQTSRHEQFTQGLPAGDVQTWHAELDAWENDHRAPNPFRTRFKGLSQSAVRNQLAEQEAEELENGVPYVMHEDVSASQLISMGIDLEDQQRRLAGASQSVGQHATDDLKAKFKLRSNTLRRKIDAWIEIQHMYVPSLRMVRSRASDAAASEDQQESSPENIPLHLPSSLPRHVECDSRLLEIEWKLRYAQCADALDGLRDAIRLRSYIYIDKSRFQFGQRANTRSQGILTRVEANVSQFAERYRASQHALSSLGTTLEKVGWQQFLRVLTHEDILPLPNNDVRARHNKQKKRKMDESGGMTSEGRRKISWIWMGMGIDTNMTEDEGLHDSLRIEWCKSKARKDRWAEEVKLLKEEMRRVLATFEHYAVVWESRAHDSQGWSLPGISADAHVHEGRIAYAMGQAIQFREMKNHCAYLWRFVGDYIRSGGEGVSLVLEADIIEDEELEDTSPQAI